MTSEQDTRELTLGCLVLGYDRGEASRRAASWALQELSANGTLVIVHACRPLHAPASPLLSDEDRAELGCAVLDELMLEGESSMFDIDVVCEISDEDPVAALLDAAERHGAHAIVVGREPHSRVRRILGTVTSVLEEKSAVPVIVVPAAAASEPAASGAA